MAVVAYYGEFLRFQDCENWIATSIDRAGHACFRMQRRPVFHVEKFIEALEMCGADILLLSKTPDISEEHLRFIKSRFKGKIVFWTFDWMLHPNNAGWYMPLAKLADVCFQTDGWGDAEYYRCFGINRVELHQGAMVDDWHKPVEDAVPEEIAKWAGDVVFVGTTYTDQRLKLTQELSRYQGFKKWGKPEPECWGRPFAIAMQHSKVVVGDNFTNAVGGYWSDRVYLALACGACFLGSRVAGMDREFTDGAHLGTWGTMDELHFKIEDLLAQPALRAVRSGIGRTEVLRAHSYKHRIAKMMEVLRG